MIRRPPRSTLSPYTTLCRSAQGHAVAPPVPGGLARHYRVQRLDAKTAIWRLVHIFPRRESAEACLAEWASRGQAVRRSEEHTSELQSRQYLVCRLLLEKKKT